MNRTSGLDPPFKNIITLEEGGTCKDINIDVVEEDEAEEGGVVATRIEVATRVSSRIKEGKVDGGAIIVEEGSAPSYCYC